MMKLTWMALLVCVIAGLVHSAIGGRYDECDTLISGNPSRCRKVRATRKTRARCWEACNKYYKKNDNKYCMKKENCEAAAEAKGYKFGGSGNYWTKGCYCYYFGSKNWAGRCYFGTHGTAKQRRTKLYDSKFRVKHHECW